MKTKNYFELFLIVLVFSFSLATMISPINGNETSILNKNSSINLSTHQCSSHQPILINSNADLIALASSEGWQGDGSALLPFIIEEFDINTFNIGVNLIEINNVDKFFVIQHNCLNYGTSGIVLNNVTNGRIVNNTLLHNTGNGFDLRYTTNIQIEENNAQNTTDHIMFVAHSKSINITNNVLVDGGGNGLYLWNLSDINIFYNVINDNYGIYMNTNNSAFAYNLVNVTTTGLTVSSGSVQNNITCNDFMSNNIGNSQAKDDGVQNIFSDNFWDDMTSPDASPQDGIVDNPYVIAGTAGNQDNNHYTSPNERELRCNPEPAPTPGWTIAVLLLSFVFMMLLKKRKL